MKIKPFWGEKLWQGQGWVSIRCGCKPANCNLLSIYQFHKNNLQKLSWRKNIENYDEKGTSQPIATSYNMSVYQTNKKMPPLHHSAPQIGKLTCDKNCLRKVDNHSFRELPPLAGTQLFPFVTSTPFPVPVMCSTCLGGLSSLFWGTFSQIISLSWRGCRVELSHFLES